MKIMKITVTFNLLNFVTYNCNSVKNKIDTVKYLTSNFDFVLLQEIMLLESDRGYLENISPHHFAYSFARDNVVNGINIGRPSKGVCFLINNKFRKIVSPIFINERIIGLVLNINNVEYLLLNVYLPVDKNSIESYHDFKTCLGEIEALIREKGINNIIISGDFNSNPNKKTLWNELKSFCNEFNLCITDYDRLAPDSFTYLSPSCFSESWLDHILCSKHLVTKIKNIEILHDLALDDHFPMSFTLNIAQRISMNSTDESLNTFDVKKFIRWDRLTNKNLVDYSSNIIKSLKNLENRKLNCITCYESDCRNKDHIDSLNNMFDVIKTIIQKASNNLVEEKQTKKNIVPGWNKYVRSFYNDARSSFKNWRLQGRPLDGALFDAMKKTKRDFRKALRKCKANELSIRNDSMVESLKRNNAKQFWKDVRSIKDNKQTKSTKIDNSVDPKNISEIFSLKYKLIFDDKNCQSGTIEFNSESESKTSLFRYFSTNCIRTAIKNLNATIGPDNIHANHLKFAPNELCVFFSKFLSSCFRHSHLPEAMTEGVFLPLIKDEFGDRESSDNYRPIMSSSVFLKLTEFAIKSKIEKYLLTDERQFGFKKESSTHLACLMLKETVLAHMKKSGNPLGCFIDISKAFDKVNFYKLFNILKLRGVNNEMLKFICNWYENQTVCVKYNNSYSSSWKLGNGVRQGAILSPFFFAVYIDALIRKISSLNQGCRLNYIMLNIIAFADDLIILAPNANALQNIINILCEGLNELNLKVNPKKTSIISFTRKKNNFPLSKIYVNKVQINYTKNVRYLGFIVDDSLSNQEDIVKCRNKFYSVFNVLLRKFYFLDANAFLKLFNAYCCQFYGADLWFGGYSCNSRLQKFAVGFHKSLKKIFKFPYYMSNTVLCNQLGILKFNHYLNWIKIRFVINLLKSRNKLVLKLSDFFNFKSELIKDTRRILDKEYGIISLLDNDKDAVLARIFFVQRHERHSTYFLNV